MCVKDVRDTLTHKYFYIHIHIYGYKCVELLYKLSYTHNSFLNCFLLKQMETQIFHKVVFIIEG